MPAPFQFQFLPQQQYRNAFAEAIAAAMARQGEIQAQGAQQQGAISANMASNIGNLAGNALNQVGQYYADAPKREFQAAQLEQMRGQMADLAQARAGRNTLQNAMASSVDPNTQPSGPPSPEQPQTGSVPQIPNFLKTDGDPNGPKVWDVAGLQQFMAARGMGLDAGVLDRVAKINDSVREEYKNKQAWQQSQQNTAAHEAGVILQAVRKAAPEQQTQVASMLFDALTERYKATGMPAGQILQLKESLLSDPAQIVAKLEQLSRGGNAPAVKLGKDDVLLNPNDLEGAPLATNHVPTKKPDYTINGQRFDGETGKEKGPLVPRQDTDKPLTTGSQEDFITTWATEHGKTVNQLTTADLATARQAYAQSGHVESATVGQDRTDVKAAVEGMKAGTIPPILPGRASREYTAMLAEAKRQGVDLVRLNEDWNATQKYLTTMNSSTQVRFRQAVVFAKDSVPLVEELVKEWDAGQFPMLNKAQLIAAKNGVLGQKAASIASRLDAQIADMTSELGTVYKGGNSSTDESLKLAASNLNSNWSKSTMLDALKQVEKNIKIRENSIRYGAPIANEGNPYAPTQPTPDDRQRVIGPNGQTGTVPKGTTLPAGWKVQ